MEGCIFCKIIKGDIPSAKIYEDEEYLAFLDINPVNKGHTLIIPKKHYDEITKLPEKMNESFMSTIQKVSKAVKKAVRCEGFNIIINTGSAAGQVVLHAHCHVIPRIQGDGFEHWKGNPYVSSEEMEEYQNNIIKEI